MLQHSGTGLRLPISAFVANTTKFWDGRVPLVSTRKQQPKSTHLTFAPLLLVSSHKLSWPASLLVTSHSAPWTTLGLRSLVDDWILSAHVPLDLTLQDDWEEGYAPTFHTTVPVYEQTRSEHNSTAANHHLPPHGNHHHPSTSRCNYIVNLVRICWVLS